VRKDLDAVAFDLDGTLYPNYRFYLRLVPFIFKEHRLLMAMGKARDALRKAAHEGRFYDLQARIMAEILRDDPERVKAKTERLIYRGWEPFFRDVKLFEGVRETLEDFRSAGLKLGLLSDFPPEKKLEYLDIDKLWDVMLCSELTGRLKPDPAPFLELSRELGVPCDRILYVGNSVAYDVVGARGVGMKTALIAPRFRKNAPADFVFSDYRQLRRYVLT
jgi:putative hydrolase of the HAD superfamily